MTPEGQTIKNILFSNNYDILKVIMNPLVLIFTNIISISILFLIIISIGQKISKILKINLDNSILHLLDIALGFATLSIFILLLSFINKVNIIGILILLTALSIFSYKEIFYYVKNIYSYKFEYREKYFSSNNFFLNIIIVFVFITFINFLTPLSSGWDSIVAYTKIPKQISETNSFVYNDYSPFFYAANLPMTIGFTLFHDDSIAKMFLFVFSILDLILLCVFTKKIFKHKKFYFIYPLLIFLMPFWNWMLDKENKIELVLIFYIMFVILLFFEYLEKKDKNIIYLSSFILGFAWTIKITSIHIIIILALLYAYYIIRYEKLKIINILKIGFLSFIIFFIPLLPWVIKNSLDYNKFTPKIFYQLQNKSEKFLDISEYAYLNNYNDDNIEDVDGNESLKNNRYIINKDFKNYLISIWHYTIPPSIGNHFPEIGLVFISILPILILFYILKKHNKNINILLFITILYFIIFMIINRGNPAPWYGIGFFFLLSTISGYFILNTKDSLTKTLLTMIIIIQVILTMSYKNTGFITDINKKLLYFYGQINILEYQDLINGSTSASMITILSNLPNDGYIYTTGNSYEYYTKDAYKRFALSDRKKVLYTVLKKRYNDEEIYKIFQKINLKYFLLIEYKNDFYNFLSSKSKTCIIKNIRNKDECLLFQLF
ncbi:MAG: hypothetical protein PHG92_03645 [Patescibacteria group bacterium]|nr:hypothetical protein [Patescibacteria group bacterium]